MNNVLIALILLSIYSAKTDIEVPFKKSTRQETQTELDFRKGRRDPFLIPYSPIIRGTPNENNEKKFVIPTELSPEQQWDLIIKMRNHIKDIKKRGIRD